MKTTTHLSQHLSRPHDGLPAAIGPTARRTSTLRLGLALSVVAAAVTIVVESVRSVPVALIVAPVVIVGFALSWHASGRRRTPGDGGSATM